MSTPSPTPAGWYPDPWDSRAQRYWDGAQWTQHTAPAAGAQAGAQPGYAQQPAGGYGYAANTYGGYTRPERPRVADDAPIYGPFIWVLALLPLVSAITIWFLHIDVQPLVDFAHRMQDYDANGGSGPVPMLDIWSILGPGYWVVMSLGWAAWIAGIVIAYFDWARLRRIGVERPFHWAFAFLTVIVYVIGRSVIVRKVAAPRGLVPIWVLVGAYAVTIVTSSIWSAIFTGDLTSQLSTVVSNT